MAPPLSWLFQPISTFHSLDGHAIIRKVQIFDRTLLEPTNRPRYVTSTFGWDESKGASLSCPAALETAVWITID